jgi:glutamyl-tRNA reductase
MRRLLLLGLNHSTAPLEVREKIAFNEAQARAALEKLHCEYPDAEFVLLSTCNRVELYVARELRSRPNAQELTEFLQAFHRIRHEPLRPYLCEKHEREAIEHLFLVTCGIDSIVLGETQIIGQIREAYQLAQVAQTVGPVLHPLFQRGLAVGKQVMQQTSLNQGKLSIASIAVEHAQKVFGRFGGTTIMCIGAGKIAQLVLQHLMQFKPRRKIITNRSVVRAQSLAEEFGGEVVPFDCLADHLPASDIVISATSAGRHVLTRDQCERALQLRKQRPLFIFDLAVPRDIDPDVGQIGTVHLQNIDQLQQAASDALSSRNRSVQHARAIVAERVEQFMAWTVSRQLGPMIQQLYKRYHTIAQQELGRTLLKLPNLAEYERQHLHELSRRIANKLAHDPIRVMKSLHQVRA